MDILVDENIPLMTVAGLRELGHDVKDIRGTGAQGLSDGELWTLAIAGGRMLITTDKGFTEHRRERHAGILVVRLRQPNRHKIHNAVLLGCAGSLNRSGPAFWVVMRDQTMSVSRPHR